MLLLLFFTQLGGFGEQELYFVMDWLDHAFFFYQWDKTYSDLLLKVMCCQASTKPPLIQKVHFSTSINNNRYRTGFLKALKQMGKPQNDPARAVTGQR